MADKSKKATPKTSASAESHVTRIAAVDTSRTKKSAKTQAKATTTRATEKKRSVIAVFKPFIALGGYFKGAWVELRQVHWPDRKATWSLTLAVLLFTAFFIVLILLLDAGFKFLFQQILG